MSMSTFLVAYVGPETMLPLTSVAAGVVGMVMMFGRNALRGLGRILKKSSDPQ